MMWGADTVRAAHPRRDASLCLSPSPPLCCYYWCKYHHISADGTWLAWSSLCSAFSCSSAHHHEHHHQGEMKFLHAVTRSIVQRSLHLASAYFASASRTRSRLVVRLLFSLFLLWHPPAPLSLFLRVHLLMVFFLSVVRHFFDDFFSLALCQSPWKPVAAALLLHPLAAFRCSSSFPLLHCLRCREHHHC